MSEVRSWVIAAAAAAVLAGFRGEPSLAAAAAGTTPAGKAQAAASQPRRNACALADRAQLEAIAKRKLDMLNNVEADDLMVCELSDAADNTLLVAVTVHWQGGKELARANAAAMSMAKQMLNQDDVDIEELTGSEKVRGLADKAFYSDLMPSWVLKGDVLIEIISPRFGHDQTKAAFLSVARSALSRLQ